MDQPDRDDFLSVTNLVKHSGMSRRTLHKWLHDPIRPLPHRMIGGKIYVLVSEYRTWADQFKVRREVFDVRKVVDEVRR
jgi:predicted DNA-binding transcriptional regulator AlpA